LSSLKLFAEFKKNSSLSVPFEYRYIRDKFSEKYKVMKDGVVIDEGILNNLKELSNGEK